MQRLYKYNNLVQNIIASKSYLFMPKATDLKIKLVAGLYKPASVKLEHGLILSSLSGMLAVAKPQLHGKRQKKTVSLNVILNKNSAWAPLDKLVHELLPRISDFRTPKFKKPSKPNYSLKLKQKFTPLADFDDLVSSEMFDNHRGIFLPLTVHCIISEGTPSQISETYLRAMRVPLQFYSRRPAPAFDDLATFQQSF
jgi:hypothetical protein